MASEESCRLKYGESTLFKRWLKCQFALALETLHSQRILLSLSDRSISVIGILVVVVDNQSILVRHFASKPETTNLPNYYTCNLFHAVFRLDGTLQSEGGTLSDTQLGGPLSDVWHCLNMSRSLACTMVFRFSFIICNCYLLRWSLSLLRSRS